MCARARERERVCMHVCGIPAYLTSKDDDDDAGLNVHSCRAGHNY